MEYETRRQTVLAETGRFRLVAGGFRPGALDVPTGRPGNWFADVEVHDGCELLLKISLNVGGEDCPSNAVWLSRAVPILRRILRLLPGTSWGDVRKMSSDLLVDGGVARETDAWLESTGKATRPLSHECAMS